MLWSLEVGVLPVLVSPLLGLSIWICHHSCRYRRHMLCLSLLMLYKGSFVLCICGGPWMGSLNLRRVCNCWAVRWPLCLFLCPQTLGRSFLPPLISIKYLGPGVSLSYKRPRKPPVCTGTQKALHPYWALGSSKDWFGQTSKTRKAQT